MGLLLLEPNEKRRFASWLRLQIETSKGMQEQLAKLVLPKALIDREKQEQAACVIVLRMIESGEDVEIR